MLLAHPPAIERRITLRLLAYWEKLRAGRMMPHENDIKPDDIADLWNQCFLIHAEHFGKSDYHYTYMGEGIAKAYMGGLEEGDASMLVSPNASRLSAIYAEMLVTRKPVINEGEFYNLRGDIVRYRQCLLPLGEGDRVAAIFGGMRFKVFRTL